MKKIIDAEFQAQYTKVNEINELKILSFSM